MTEKQFQQLKQLWMIRFQKMVNLEKDSLFFYSAVLKKHKIFLEGTRTWKVLESIMKDEAKHTQIAAELVHIVEGKKYGK